MGENKGRIATIIILSIVLVGLIVSLIILNNNGNQSTPTSTVEMSVNPAVELVVDSNNKVVSVNYENEDAEIIFSKDVLVGKSIEEVARMFVKNATEAGYIDVNTDGTTVTITVNGISAEDIEKLENKIISTVNKYFDENGIIAGAVSGIKEDVKALADELGVTVEKYRLMLKAKGEDAKIKLEDLKDKTEKELMDMINSNIEEMKGVALEKKAELEKRYNELYNTMKSKQEQALGFISEYFSIEGLSIDEIKAQIQKSTIIPENMKASLIANLDSVKENIKGFETDFKNDYEKAKNQIKEDSKAVYEAYKTQMNDKINLAKSTINAHKAYFDENKAEIENKIQEYRNSLKNVA
ncbi:MAG: hypothetical protein ACI4TX_00725 [Christensenellales bacterium]